MFCIFCIGYLNKLPDVIGDPGKVLSLASNLVTLYIENTVLVLLYVVLYYYKTFSVEFYSVL